MKELNVLIKENLINILWYIMMKVLMNIEYIVFNVIEEIN